MTTKNICKSYSEMMSFDTYWDRLKYLSLYGSIGDFTFGGHRHLNQQLYKSLKWKKIKREVILRDNGCDLAMDGYKIYGAIYIHHMNPITIEDILNEDPSVFDPENLVCTSFLAHNTIHYGSENALLQNMIERKKNDTCLWR